MFFCVLLVVLTVRLPPCSSLFPYTTLFRSRWRVRTTHRPLNGVYGPDEWGYDEIVRDEYDVALPRQAAPGAYDVRVRIDRKSTRLNSSHSSISYAVFCLKKKKY